MCDHSEYTEECAAVEYIIGTEELLVEPGDIVISRKASDKDLKDLIDYLIETKGLSWE